MTIYTAKLRSRVNTLTHERDWFVTTTHPEAHTVGDRFSGYWPQQGGDASLKACQTWLANRGFVCKGDMPPDVFEYTAIIEESVACPACLGANLNVATHTQHTCMHCGTVFTALDE